jgi:hypothetical protein
MYIPQFWLGFVVGVVATIVGVLVLIYRVNQAAKKQ